MRISRKSVLTGHIHTMELNVTQSQIDKWQGGELIQNYLDRYKMKLNCLKWRMRNHAPTRFQPIIRTLSSHYLSNAIQVWQQWFYPPPDVRETAALYWSALSLSRFQRARSNIYGRAWNIGKAFEWVSWIYKVCWH